MKRGYGMYLFLLSWYFLSQTTDIHYLPIMAHFQKWVIFKLVAGHELSNFCGSSLKRNGGVFLHRKAHCVTIFSYDQFQLISLFINDFSIMTNNDVDRAKVCCPSFCYKNAKKCRWSAFTSKYIAQKMKGKQYVPLERKRKKKSSLTPAIWDPSTYHEYDIHKLLTLLFYSTCTILKLIPALRYASPPSPMPYVLQILNKFDLQLYKT